MAYLTSRDQISNINWGRSYLWDIRFPSAPAPFNSWFPATDYVDNPLHSNSAVHQFYLKTYKTPQDSATPDIQITFADDVNGSLYKWLSDWYKFIYDDRAGGGVACLADSVRPLYVQRLNLNRSPIETKMLYVYPDGSVPDSWSSQSDGKVYTTSFVVAG